MDLEILSEDRDWIAVRKMPGLLSEDGGEGKPSLPRLLREYLHTERGERDPYVGVLHRLDRDVGGVMLFARNKKAAADLSAQIVGGTVRKEYLAVVCGTPPERGELSDLLYHDPRRAKTFVVNRMRRGVREASLSYRVLARTGEGSEARSLIHVLLHTGRTHQIRVQFSSRRWPVAGDGRYGGGSGRIALFSAAMTFVHPVRGDSVRITALPEWEGEWARFSPEAAAAALEDGYYEPGKSQKEEPK